MRYHRKYVVSHQGSLAQRELSAKLTEGSLGACLLKTKTPPGDCSQGGGQTRGSGTARPFPENKKA